MRELLTRSEVRFALPFLLTFILFDSLALAEEIHVSKIFTPPKSFTPGIEGPAVDANGNVYAVNYEKQMTIGKVTQDGKCSVFVELPDGSVGNGIRFDSQGKMFVADYVRHNVLKIDPATREVTVLAQHDGMNTVPDPPSSWR